MSMVWIFRQSSADRYNADVSISLRISLLWLLISPALLKAQEVRLVDLLDVEQRTALRFPRDPSCAAGELCAGSVGGSGADGASDPRDTRALGVALDRVAPTDVTLDSFEAEFRILN